MMCEFIDDDDDDIDEIFNPFDPLLICNGNTTNFSFFFLLLHFDWQWNEMDRIVVHDDDEKNNKLTIDDWLIDRF